MMVSQEGNAKGTYLKENGCALFVLEVVHVVSMPQSGSKFVAEGEPFPLE